MKAPGEPGAFIADSTISGEISVAFLCHCERSEAITTNKQIASSFVSGGLLVMTLINGLKIVVAVFQFVWQKALVYAIFDK